MSTPQQVSLSDYTTMRVGGPAELVTVAGADDLIDAVTAADDDDRPVLLVGGGSNLVISDDGFAGLAVHLANGGARSARDGDQVVIDIQGGEPWETVVEHAVAEGLSGIECLSGIPGLTGATPVQNVGAYGAEIADVLVSVQVYDRLAGERRTLKAADCGFGYRTSIFKHSHQYLVLEVRLRLEKSTNSVPIRYAELARALGVDVGARAPLQQVRDAVLALRRSKGMVLDSADHDTWSAGSFFTNPIVAPAAVPPGAPAYDAGGGMVKTSAAWLIDHADFTKGYGNERASLSTKHTLALTNRGGASASDIVALAREIRDGVQGKYGIELRPEPMLVGLSL